MGHARQFADGPPNAVLGLSCRRPPARTVGVDEALAGIRGADAIVGSTSSGETVNPADA